MVDLIKPEDCSISRVEYMRCWHDDPIHLENLFRGRGSIRISEIISPKRGSPPPFIDQLLNEKGIDFTGSVKSNEDADIYFESHFLNGKLHREGGPARIYTSKYSGRREEYFIHGIPHRENGPARTFPSSDVWMLDGFVDRVDSGPVVIRYKVKNEDNDFLVRGAPGSATFLLRDRDGKRRLNLRYDDEDRVWKNDSLKVIEHAELPQ